MNDFDMDEFDTMREQYAQRKAVEEQTKVIIYCTMAIIFALAYLLSDAEVKAQMETGIRWIIGAVCVFGFFEWPMFRTGLFLAVAAGATWLVISELGFKPKEWSNYEWLLIGVPVALAGLSSTFNQWLVHKRDFSKWWKE